MFCGLPIRVAAEPTFAAQARASRNGIGSSFRRTQPSARTGAIARQMMSLHSSADNAPAATMITANKTGGETSNSAIRVVNRV
jgi:hypothetical protein